MSASPYFISKSLFLSCAPKKKKKKKKPVASGSIQNSPDFVIFFFFFPKGFLSSNPSFLTPPPLTHLFRGLGKFPIDPAAYRLPRRGAAPSTPSPPLPAPPRVKKGQTSCFFPLMQVRKSLKEKKRKEKREKILSLSIIIDNFKLIERPHTYFFPKSLFWRCAPTKKKPQSRAVHSQIPGFSSKRFFFSFLLLQPFLSHPLPTN